MQNACILLGLLLAADVVCWRIFPTSMPRIRLAVRIVFFTLYSLIVFYSGLSPLQPVGEVGSPALHLATVTLIIIWWFLSARILTDVLGAVLLSRTGGGGRLLQEVVGALIFLFATVAAAAYVLELPVKGLLATSGALAIIVGLALQSTLGDLFSGIVLNATRPYQVGDWIQIDGVEGTVTDIDWRATLLLTTQGSTVVIPNSVAAKTKIQNLSRPNDKHGIMISLHLPLKFRPEKVQDSLEQALHGYRDFILEPKPKVMMKGIFEGLLEYEVGGFIRHPEDKISARNRLYDLAYRHLRAAGIDPGGLAEIPAAEQTLVILNDVKVFSGFSTENKEHLARGLITKQIAQGDYILKADAISEQLLVISSGVVSVQLLTGTTWLEVARMGPGEILGEQGIIDDAPNGGQFIALTSVTVFELKKESVRACMMERSALRTSLSRLQMVRQQHARSFLMQKAPKVPKGGFLEWLKIH